MARQPHPTAPHDDNLGIDSETEDRSESTGKAPAHTDNVLESLGKAIIAPVKNTADPDDDPTTR